MPDAWETTHQFNPSSAADALLDFDLDGLSNLREFLAGTNPRDADSDDDGASDGVELDRNFNPLSAASLPTWFHFNGRIDDLDDDGLSDSWVLWSGGKSRLPVGDDDGDGMSNLEESKAGTHPDDAGSRLDLMGWRRATTSCSRGPISPTRRGIWRPAMLSMAGRWSPACPNPASSAGAGSLPCSIEFPAAGATRFYRTGVGATRLRQRRRRGLGGEQRARVLSCQFRFARPSRW